jgi:hypothetical protein
MHGPLSPGDPVRDEGVITLSSNRADEPAGANVQFVRPTAHSPGLANK